MAHLDFKSPNVFVTCLDPSQGQICAKIAGFGTSQEVTEPITIGKVDNPTWQGTQKKPKNPRSFENLILILFLAPEILSGQPYNEKVDTYAFGIILWELVTRQLPFNQLSFISDVASSVIAGERPTVPEEIPKDYAKLMQVCWVSLFLFSSFFLLPSSFFLRPSPFFLLPSSFFPSLFLLLSCC